MPVCGLGTSHSVHGFDHGDDRAFLDFVAGAHMNRQTLPPSGASIGSVAFRNLGRFREQ